MRRLPKRPLPLAVLLVGNKRCKTLPQSLYTTFSSAAQREDVADILKGLSAQLQITKLEDWYSVTQDQVIKKGGERLYQNCSSLCEALEMIYPEFPWEAEAFRTTQKKGFWKNIQEQRVLADYIAHKLQIKAPEGWYEINRSMITEAGGAALFRVYGSLLEMLKGVYPEYQWDPARFNPPTRRTKWNNKDNIMQALSRAEEALNIKHPEDWFTVHLTDLWQVGFPSKVSKVELAELLREKYPDFSGWEKVFLLRGKYAQQKRLEKVVQSLFPEVELKFNARKEAELLSATGNFLELDIYIPSLALAFEFQEKHHYVSTGYTYESVEKIKARDEEKKRLANEKGITLIVVPFWWDGTTDSLVATIKAVRSDLLPKFPSEGTAVIPEVMPENIPVKIKNAEVEGIGEPTTASFFTLSSVDPAGWWMFEKYDGVRGFWNPDKKAFYSRSGREITMPQDVINSMPSDTFLDGELWFGRNNFEAASRMCNTYDTTLSDWKLFKYMVFDLPNHTGTYEQRYTTLVETVTKSKSPYLSVAPAKKCVDMNDLENFYQTVMDNGGEGIILRDPTSLLQPGRSAGYLKHKKFRDAEAKVVGIAGQYQWECELPNGVRFLASAGSTEFTRRWQPQIGDIVSFKHRGFLASSKTPKFPTIYRLRTDITWEDVKQNWKEQKPLGSAPALKSSRRYTPKGYWNKIENRRKAITEIAAKMGFDPLKPENWANITTTQFIANGGGSLLSSYNGSIPQLLRTTFPGYNFDNLSEKKPKGFWDVAENRRKYCIEYAGKHGFDPFKPENWENVTTTQFIADGGGSLLNLYKGSMSRMLQANLPEISFTSDKKPKGYWDVAENRRNYCIEYAEKLGFDPFKPEDWANVATTQFIADRGGSLLNCYKGSMYRMLQDTFPELDFSLLADKRQKGVSKA